MSTVSQNEQLIVESLRAELREARAALDQLSQERTRLSEALRSSEEFKSRLIACSRDCIKVLDLEGRLIFMNQGGMQVLEICDLTPFLNGCWIEFWEGGDREKALAAIEQARKGGVGRFTGYFETKIHREPRWWDVVVSPIRDSAGTPVQLLAVSRDVTEQKLSDDALREALQTNREIIEWRGRRDHSLRSSAALSRIQPFHGAAHGYACPRAFGKARS